MEEKILKLLVDITSNKDIVNERNLNLFDMDLLDSLGIVEVILKVEEEFQIKLDPLEIEKEDMSTVNKFLDFMKRKII